MLGKTESRCYDVAIVGGGFSGTCLAVQLLKQSLGPIGIAIVNRLGLTGRGVAYGTEYDEHLLNVSVGKMSLIPDDPEHFVRWLEQVHGYIFPTERFVPRRLYGEYIEDTLSQTLTECPNAALALCLRYECKQSSLRNIS